MFAAGAADFNRPRSRRAPWAGGHASALILGVISWVLLSVGGYLGGELTFIYGVRLLCRP
jgi:uncharacterized membrane protein